MAFLETTIILVSSSLFLCLLLFLTNLLHKIWWTPISIKHMMGSQGIGGPPYRFIHGNNKEIVKMRIESMSRPMDLSHDIFPRILPHQHSWLNTYGTTNILFSKFFNPCFMNLANFNCTLFSSLFCGNREDFSFLAWF